MRVRSCCARSLHPKDDDDDDESNGMGGQWRRGGEREGGTALSWRGGKGEWEVDGLSTLWGVSTLWEGIYDLPRSWLACHLDEHCDLLGKRRLRERAVPTVAFKRDPAKNDWTWVVVILKNSGIF